MNLPKTFVDFCAANTPLAQLPRVLADTEPEVSVRVNLTKGICTPSNAPVVLWNPAGFYLDGRPPFTFDPALHQGLYYVQDASSMAIGHVIRRLTAGCVSPLLYLDACAAPGGKTTAAIDALPEGSLVVANEFDPRRAAALAENVERWGSPSVIVRRGDTEAFASAGHVFDLIAADVPCSGEGMMRKESAAVEQWSTALVSSCARLQRQIVANLWPALRPEGYLIYSTCTFNRAENEDNVRWIMETFGAEPVETGLCDFDGVLGALDNDITAARFIPGHIRGEGLFIAVLRKPAGDGAQFHAAKKSGRHKNAPRCSVDKKLLETASSWLSDSLIVEASDERLRALPAVWSDTIHLLGDCLGGILYSGTDIATIKGRDLLPAHPLALSAALRPDAFPNAEVDYPTAIAFLRREPICLSNTPRGIVLLTYGDRPLGFVKNLGNRANNLLPANRRILSASTPGSAPQVI